MIFMISCKPQTSSPTGNTTENAIVEIPADFASFYERFHTDSSYQVSHINFPLKGIDTDSLQNMQQVEVYWQQENWRIHRPFNDYNGTYRRDFTNINGLIVETISSNDGQYAMERRYAKLGEAWTLIFYASMRQVVMDRN